MQGFLGGKECVIMFLALFKAMRVTAQARGDQALEMIIVMIRNLNSIPMQKSSFIDIINESLLQDNIMLEHMIRCLEGKTY